jgi:hypothetical protein
MPKKPFLTTLQFRFGGLSDVSFLGCHPELHQISRLMMINIRSFCFCLVLLPQLSIDISDDGYVAPKLYVIASHEEQASIILQQTALLI